MISSKKLNSLMTSLFCVCLLLVGMGGTLLAESDSPIGLWQTYDEDTGEPNGQILIYEKDGKLQGKIHQTRPEDADRVCCKCKGERRNQPVLGMVILWDFAPKDDDEWEGGQMLAPKTGKIFKGTMKLEEGGEKLRVRGYAGAKMFGRTEIWDRIE